jgi:FdhE protein
MVANYPWERRIERAKELAQSMPHVQEVVSFYAEILKWQRDLFRRIPAASGKHGLSGHFEHDHPHFLNRFDSLLELVRQRGSMVLAAQAEKLSAAKTSSKALLAAYWNGELAPEEAFFARTCLQPYLERLAESQMPPADSMLRAALTMEREEFGIDRPHRRCPFCGRKPQLTVLSNETGVSDGSEGSVEGGRRFLICGDCLTWWPFQRIACVNCLEEDPSKLSSCRAEARPEIRLECCDSCRHYIKSIDLTRNNRCVPIVDELAAIPLDLWAHEQGYHKIQSNLAGM